MLSGLRALVRARLTRARFRRLQTHKPPLSAAEQRTFLFWVPGGMPVMLDVEGAIAQALILRGHKVHAILCDGVATACVRREAGINPNPDSWAQECAECRKACKARLDSFDIEHSFVGNYVDAALLPKLRAVASTLNWEALADFKYEGIELGKNIQSSILRYFKGAGYNGDSRLVQEYAYRALVTLTAAKKSYATHAPTHVFMSHGIYVDWGPALRVALEQRLQATCWAASYLPAKFYFRHPTDYRIDLDFQKLDESTWSEESKRELTAEEASRVRAYLDNRYINGQTFDLKRTKSYRGETDSFKSHYGLRRDRKVWGVMVHVNWDAVTDYAPMLFANFEEWIVTTMRRIQSVDSVDWLVKIHPAEAWDNPTTGMQALIGRLFPRLPEHVRIVGFDENICPLDFYSLIDGAVTVYGTAGLEIACLGKPVIVAGDAHYSKKGFTHDPGTIDEYLDMLGQAGGLAPLLDRQKRLALRYAHIYFIQRQIPFPPVRNPRAHREQGFWRFQPEAADMLAPHANEYVEFILQRILDGREFILSGELIEQQSA